MLGNNFISYVTRVVNFPEISGNISKSLAFSFKFADIHRSRAKTSYFFKIMHKVKTQRSGELFVKNMLILRHRFATLDMETAD